MIAVLSSSYPLPMDSGRKVVIAGFVQYLCARYGPERVVFIYLAHEIAERLEPLPCETVVLPLPGRMRRLLRAMVQSLILRRRALQEAVLFSAVLARRVEALLADCGARLVLVDTVRLADYARPRQGTRWFLYLDDLYSLRYRRLLEAVARYPEVDVDPLGTFGRFFPGFVRQALGARGLQWALLRLESRILARREAEVTRQFERVLLLNEQEATALAQKSGAGNVVVVSPMLDVRPGESPRTFDGTGLFVFLGNLQYPANSFALSYFLRTNVARLQALSPKLRLLVIGRGASAGLAEQVKVCGSCVEMLGYVEELAPVLAGAAGMVVPLLYGSGLNIKVIEALAHGLPVVTTPIGASSIPLVHGVHALIEPEIARFPKAMCRLLDPETNAELSRNARALFETKYRRDIAVDAYERTFAQPN